MDIIILKLKNKYYQSFIIEETNVATTSLNVNVASSKIKT